MKKNIVTNIIALAAIITLMAACTESNEALQLTNAPVAITATVETPATRAPGDVKTTFAPGDVITLNTTAKYTLQDNGTWILTSGDPLAWAVDNPAITITATYTTGKDHLEATADNHNLGGITLNIDPATGLPLWNITLSFTHTNAVANVVVIDEDMTNITHLLQSLTITTSQEAVTTTSPKDIILQPGTLSKVAITLNGIEYDAMPATTTTLAANHRYNINFVASPQASTVTITPAATDNPGWNPADPTPSPAGYDYWIYTREDLAAWAEDMADDTNLGKTAIQMANINWNANWVPVGINSAYPFTGVYNGNGYTITGLNIESYGRIYCAGMFGCIDKAVLAGIHLRGVTITATNSRMAESTGLLVGSIGTTGQTTISLCSTQGVIETNTENNYTGGLVGYASNNVHITRCYADVTITGISQNADVRIGGLVGHTRATIVACAANANINITATNTCYAGGLVGNNNNTIQFGYTTGNVNVTGTYDNSGNTGSFLGYSDGIIANCYTTATANGTVTNNYPTGVTTTTDPTTRRTFIGAAPEGSEKTSPSVRTILYHPVKGYNIIPAVREFVSTDVWNSDDAPGIVYTDNGKE